MGCTMQRRQSYGMLINYGMLGLVLYPREAVMANRVGGSWSKMSQTHPNNVLLAHPSHTRNEKGLVQEPQQSRAGAMGESKRQGG